MKYPEYKNDKLPQDIVNALKTGRVIIRQVMHRPIKSNGEESAAPVSIQFQQLVDREVNTSSSDTLGLTLRLGELGDLSVVNVTAWENLSEEIANKILGPILGSGNFSYNAMDDGETIYYADKVFGMKDIGIQITENFFEDNDPNSAKINPATGVAVVAEFNGTDSQVYRHTVVKVKNAAHKYIDPNGLYAGDPERPRLVEEESLEEQALTFAAR